MNLWIKSLIDHLQYEYSHNTIERGISDALNYKVKSLQMPDKENPECGGDGFKAQTIQYRTHFDTGSDRDGLQLSGKAQLQTCILCGAYGFVWSLEIRGQVESGSQTSYTSRLDQ